jgi:peroxiredoxin Q/BCP
MEFTRRNTVIIGISGDKPEAQKKWAEDLKLPFRLLSDPDSAIHRKYGAWGEKTMYGKKSEGAIRSTFLIGADGVVIKAWRNVKAQGHAAAVLDETPE